MMAAMTVFPRKIRDKETRVEDKTNDVIEQLIVTKGMMTTLMSQDPNAC
jgi:hypothetical protein